MRRLALAAVALLAVAAGCGGDAGREARETYIEAVNRAEDDVAAAVRQSQQAIRAFAAGRTTARTAERLRQASGVMRAARASIVLVEPPREARALHGDVLRLLDVQADMALELALAADYTRSIAEAILPAQLAARELGARLRRAGTAAAQAAEMRRYARRVGVSLDRLDALAPPPFLLPWHESQTRRLVASRRHALALAAGIDARDPEAVDRSLRALTRAPVEGGARAAQALAVRRFNRRLAEQHRLLTRIARAQALLRAG